jgi:hypothetical protein
LVFGPEPSLDFVRVLEDDCLENEVCLDLPDAEVFNELGSAYLDMLRLTVVLGEGMCPEEIADRSEEEVANRHNSN